MYISRKLEEIHQELDLLGGQGETAGFLANAENAQRISGIVEDIREVMMDYQVRALTHSFVLSPPNEHVRLLCNKTSMTRLVNSWWVLPTTLPPVVFVC